MKIAVAQTRPIIGDIAANVRTHVQLMDLAAAHHAGAIFFPELSLTGYEPALANKLATSQHDKIFDPFQDISRKNKISIGLGMPLRTDSGIRISMVIFQPGKPRQFYSKQLLHADELPFFESGAGQTILEIDNIRIAPAICYESLQTAHADHACRLGAEIYLASVAKPQKGIDKALTHYPAIARNYAMPVLMSNCVGTCDDFESVGQSSVWTKQGRLAAQLDNKGEGILIFDTATEEVIKQSI